MMRLRLLRCLAGALAALVLFAPQARACDCARPGAEDSRRILAQAYIVVHGTVREVTPLTQRYGVIDPFGPSRALIEVAYAYDQRLGGPLYVDFNRTYSNCEIGVLETGEERDFLVFKDDDNALYLPNRCVDLTAEHWAELHKKAAGQEGGD